MTHTDSIANPYVTSCKTYEKKANSSLKNSHTIVVAGYGCKLTTERGHTRNRNSSEMVLRNLPKGIEKWNFHFSSKQNAKNRFVLMTSGCKVSCGVSPDQGIAKAR